MAKLMKNKNLKEIEVEKKLDSKLYYLENELLEYGYDENLIRKLKQYISCYKYKEKSNKVYRYFLKSDIKKINDWKNSLGYINDLSIHFDMCYRWLYILLDKHKFEILTKFDQPFSVNSMYNLKDFEKIENAILENLPKDILDKNKYINLLQAQEMIDKDDDCKGMIFTNKTADLFELKYIYNTKIYLKRDEVEKLVNDNKKTIDVKDMSIYLSEELGVKTRNIRKIIDKKIITNGVEKFSKHLFKGHNLRIYKEDAEKIYKEIIAEKKYEDELNNIKSGIERYKFFIKDIEVKKSIQVTMEIYDEYVTYRFKDIKSIEGNRVYSKEFSEIKNLLNLLLNKEIYKYSEELMDKMIIQITNKYNDLYSQRKKLEIVGFYNYIIQKKSLDIPEMKGRNLYNLSKRSICENSEEVLAYTKEEFLNLFKLIYGSTFDNKFIKKAIEKRSNAVVWLYMYLHYTTIFRRKDITRIPFPNINNIGFKNGNQFLRWLDEGNEFTEDMGFIICEEIKKKLDIFGMKAGKNDGDLVLEIGRLHYKSLGMLFCICEAHRQVADDRDEYMEHNTMINDGYIKRKEYYTELFGEEIDNILKKECFSNRRANKSINNYIHDYSEENGDNVGEHIISIMRGYVLNNNFISETTPIYETRHVDGTIKDIVATLFNRGSFAFEKFKFATMLDSNFKDKNSEEQTKYIQDLELTPYEVEAITKNIYYQRQKTSNIICKLISNTDDMTNILRELAKGNTHGKHKYTRCLLKAILNCKSSGDETELNNLLNISNGKNCMFEEFYSCIGCPCIIEEMHFLYEVNDLIQESINKLKNTDNDYEKYMLSKLIFSTYLPILKESQAVLGKEKVNTYVDIKKMNMEIKELHTKNCIRLEYIRE